MQQKIFKFGWLINLLLIGGLNLTPVPATAGQMAEQEAWSVLAKAMEGNPTAKETLRHAITFLTRYPQSHLKPAAKYVVGEFYFRSRKYQQALPYYKWLADKLEPISFGDSVMFRLGECHYNMGKIDQAVKIWSAIPGQYPKTHLKPEIKANRCRILLQQSKYRPAAGLYRDLLSRYPFYRKNNSVLAGLARIDIFNQKYAQALERLAQLHTPEALYLKGRCLLALEQYPALVNYFNESGTKHGDTRSHNLIKESWVWALLEKEQYTFALAAAEHILADQGIVETSRDAMLLVKGHCRFNLNQYQTALTIYTRWLKKNRSPSERLYVRYLLGLTYYRLQDQQKALQIWEEIFADPPRNNLGRDILLTVADTLLEGGNYIPAQRYFDFFIQKYPDDPNRAAAYQRISQVYYKLDKDHAAMKAYQNFIRLPSANPITLSSPSAIQTPDLPKVKNHLPPASLRIRYDKLISGYVKGAMTSASLMTGSPWLTLISKPPILEIKSPKRNVILESWKFTVSTDGGNILYTQTGGDRLPQKFIWDGVDRDGRQLNVGEHFQYSITLVKPGGKPFSASHKPKTLTSLVYHQNNNLHISLLSSLLFNKKTTSNLSSIGASFMKESCDYIIKNIRRTINIEITAVEPLSAQAQGKTIRKYIVDKLNLPEEDINLKVLPSQNPLTDHVNIICL
ncbi:tetratricopeptide repeat protein [bacterium]|nr:tetratricopeptide repeat protein [bacterium]